MNVTIVRIEKPLNSAREIQTSMSESEFEELSGEPIQMKMLDITKTSDIPDYSPTEMVEIKLRIGK